tara:strand:+ start:43 stop:222 length:180 start_codon:yes stop_codon:yes gene_type:complete
MSHYVVVFVEVGYLLSKSACVIVPAFTRAASPSLASLAFFPLLEAKCSLVPASILLNRF